MTVAWWKVAEIAVPKGLRSEDCFRGEGGKVGHAWDGRTVSEKAISRFGGDEEKALFLVPLSRSDKISRTVGPIQDQTL